MSKRVAIEQDEKGAFSVVGTVSNIETLGMLEFAKATLMTNMLNPPKQMEKQATDSNSADKSGE